MEFNKLYYEDIWGTIHRHDYCESLADRLIQLYGSCRILDIGTGCGELVRVLREKGCDAFGLEISDYAVENSCCKDYVRKGDIRDIPFASQRFDVVHSQGVWGYFKDIQIAWNECKRVGKIQHHNIDYNDTIPEHRYLIAESEDWWKNQFYEKILVACPTHECKEYSFQKWIDTIKQLSYPNYDILVVDNSASESYLEKYKNQIPIIHIDSDQQHEMLRITQSMAVIRKHFLNGSYSRWFNVEADVIIPPDSVEKMLYYGKQTDWVSHSYPMRGGKQEDAQQGIGCSMLSRKLIEKFDFNNAGDNSPDNWLWNLVRPAREFTTMELWGYINTEHLEK